MDPPDIMHACPAGTCPPQATPCACEGRDILSTSRSSRVPGVFGFSVRACGGCSFLDLFESTLDVLLVFDLESLRVLEISRATASSLNLDDDVIRLGLMLSDFVPKAVCASLVNELTNPRIVRPIWKGATTLQRRGGDSWLVQALSIRARTGSETSGTAVFVALDRSDLADALGGMQREQGLLRALLDHLPDAVYFKDADCRFIQVSTAMAAKVAGGPASSMVGRTDFDFFSAEHAQEALEDEQRIIRTGTAIVNKVEKETWPDGREAWVASTKLPLFDEAGGVVGTFGISRDITAARHAEEQQRHSEVQQLLTSKLESIGRLAAGIAHEINTPTQFIGDNTSFLADGVAKLAGLLEVHRALREAAAPLSACGPALRLIEAAEAEAELDYLLVEVPLALRQTAEGVARIARIVRSLKEFSHPSAPDLQPADINHAIETAMTVTRHEWKYVADIVTEFAPDLPLVPCVLDEFNQVLLNLIVNAAHAIDDVVKDSGQKGTITIRTRVESTHAVVEVADTGTGIPPAVRRHIFEPFFTTKAMGKGTGQGLAVVHTVIVKKHQGTIDCATESGVGTTFTLRLPLHSNVACPPAAPLNTQPLLP